MIDVRELKENHPEFALLLETCGDQSAQFANLCYTKVPVHDLEVGSHILVRAGEVCCFIQLLCSIIQFSFGNLCSLIVQVFFFLFPLSKCNSTSCILFHLILVFYSRFSKILSHHGAVFVFFRLCLLMEKFTKVHRQLLLNTLLVKQNLWKGQLGMLYLVVPGTWKEWWLWRLHTFSEDRTNLFNLVLFLHFAL